tara:strand:+ start:139 stop:543 length:405 start_codon:yes stop_codon:yes gene_type:complete
MMKKIIFFIILLFSISSSLKAASFSWTKIVETASGSTEFYIDKKTVFGFEKFKYYWQLSDYLKDYEEIRSVITLNVINCDTQEQKILSFTGYSKNMAKGDILTNATSNELEDSWDYYENDTAIGMLMKRVCNMR